MDRLDKKKIIQLCPVPSNIRITAVFKDEQKHGSEIFVSNFFSPVAFFALTNEGEVFPLDFDGDAIFSDVADSGNFERLEINYEN